MLPSPSRRLGVSDTHLTVVRHDGIRAKHPRHEAHSGLNLRSSFGPMIARHGGRHLPKGGRRGRQAGIDIVKGPEKRRDGTAVFVRDPDGVRVELQLTTRPTA